jgi:hypothetical protein
LRIVYEWNVPERVGSVSAACKGGSGDRVKTALLARLTSFPSEAIALSALSDWFGRIVARSLARSEAKSPLAQVARQRYIDALLQQERYADPRRLARFEHQAFSQGGEDGAIREIFRRIGETNRVFVELGVGNGLENNTAFLLCQGWSGVWIEGAKRNAEAIRTTCAREIADGRLKLIEASVTAENAAALIARELRSPQIDLLSIDVDRNTYHIWAALDALKPRAAVIEYNAMFPADLAWIAEYDAEKWWNGTSYFGASLKALEELGARMGQVLVGCDIAGTNAFFVRSDLCGDKFSAPFTAGNHYEPARYYLHARTGHRPALHD